MIDLQTAHPGLSNWLHAGTHCDDEQRSILLSTVQQRWDQHNHGDMPRWQQALYSVQRSCGKQQGWRVDDDLLILGKARPRGDAQSQLMPALRELMPWRKGPLRLQGIDIDSEWRSDWKWQRLRPHLPNLTGLEVLDVGSGNGYFGYRLLSSGAKAVLALDPTWLFVMQHQAMQAAAGEANNWVLPLRLENFPAFAPGFDAALSLGVLYHRRDPLAHLRQLRQQLRRHGLLVLETFILPPGEVREMSPQRYARMRNVHRIPQACLLLQWLQEAGFSDCRMVDISRTSVLEQRSTDWMRFQSLPQALDQNNQAYTVEGLPAPRRAIVLARKR